MGKVKDITGEQINGWTVIKECGRNKGGGAMFLCQCVCGNYRVVEGRSIRAGTSKNCGCARKTKTVEASKRVTIKHGGRYDRLYQVWHGMKDRCNNPNSKHYARYGGRGIKLCSEWDESYEAFKKWAQEHGYNETLAKYQCTIERLDNDKGYSPENCVWANQKTQCNNRSNNHLIEFNGLSHTLSEWAEITGIKKDTLRRRLCEYGWDTERALTEPTRAHSRKT